MAQDYGTLSPYDPFYQPSYAQLERNRAGNSADRPGYSHLGSALGNMFFGGGARADRELKMFNEGATGQVKLQDLIMKATKDRDAEIGRQGMIQKAMDSGRSDIADMIRNSPNAASAGEAQLHAQAHDWGDEEWKMIHDANAGDPAAMELMARMNAVRAPGQAPDLTKIGGGVAFSPYKTPGDQTMIETPESESQGALRAAQGDTARARTAYIEGPQTAKALRPPVGRTSGDLPAADLKLLFSDGAGGQDDAAIKDFKIWMTDNNLTNERTSIGRYLKEQRAKAPATPTATTPDEEQPSTIRGLFNSVVSPEMQKTLFGGLGTDVKNAVSPGGGKVQGGVGDSPYPEGTQLKGKDGKMYVVKNGQPVPQ